eukprot:TRINITY_DN32844_c0_g1_i1.p1 TRINITY_DN32844_c0_g1~~TRINITY_DN32844_c0_g1_i1.p1  ORF type:complete len:618 (+),score=144.12 TRINITY_DN32844_c0_g1_i1:68-1921(+)
MSNPLTVSPGAPALRPEVNRQNSLVRAPARTRPRLQSTASGGDGRVGQLEPLCISGDREIQFGLRWDFVGDEPIDLDASCASFDMAGNPGEVVFFNNLVTKGEWMIHTGDNTTGEGDDDDEAIQICLRTVPRDVQYLMLSITCHNKGYDFSHVEQIECGVTDLETGASVIEGGIPVHLSRLHTAAIVCSLRRIDQDGVWELQVHNMPAHGHHVGDTRLLNTMQGLLDIPEELRNTGDVKFQYDTRKRDVAQLPLDLNHLMFGVGWVRDDSDLDSTVVMLDHKGRYVDHASSKSKHETADGSTVHHGDNAFDALVQQKDTKSRGDKEQINIRLEQVSPVVHFVFLVVTVVTREHVWNVGRLGNTPGAYCRLAHLTKKKAFKGGTTNEHDRVEVCRTSLTSLKDATCLIFTAVFREAATGRWAIEKIDEAMSGTGQSTPDDFIPFVRCISYFMQDSKLRSPLGWPAFRERARKEKMVLQVTIVEARDLGPEDRSFDCHCQAWVMDRPREKMQRKHTSRLQDRGDLTWNESFDFRVSYFDAIRVMCYDWGFVGTVDLPLARVLPLSEPGFALDPGFMIDDWFPLQGPEVEGSLHLQLMRSSNTLSVTKDDSGDDPCCVVL